MTGTPGEPTVFVLDDDRMARESVCALVRSLGVRAESFASAADFLTAYSPDRAGCLVADVRMRGTSGGELQQELNEAGVRLPAIMLTARTRTHVIVRAMQQGAVTVLDKPHEEDELWDAVRQALAEDATRRERYERMAQIRGRLNRLSDKERDVLESIMAGKPNKTIARELGVSIRTVENRRNQIFSKTETESLAELVRMVIDANSGA